MPMIRIRKIKSDMFERNRPFWTKRLQYGFEHIQVTRMGKERITLISQRSECATADAEPSPEGVRLMRAGVIYYVPRRTIAAPPTTA